MSIDEQYLKELGALILNAGDDKFGLRTDGQGNVIIPAGSNFMTEVLKLDRKYIAFADYDHETKEQDFTQKNIEAIKRYGVKKIFDELNLQEMKALEQDVLSNNLSDDESEYSLIRKAGISHVASDPRKEKDFTQKKILEERRATLDKASTIINGYINETFTKETIAEFRQTIEALSKSYFDGDLSKTFDNTTAILECGALLKQKALASHPVDDALLNQITNLYSLVMDDPLNTEKRRNLMPNDLMELSKEIGSVRREAKTQLNALNEKIVIEAGVANPVIADQVTKESASQQKVVLRWGLGHFWGTNDLDEMLGRTQVLVIATVFDDAEMDRCKAHIRGNKMADAPDYIYMPERMGDDGKVIPEKVISVAEYLAAQQRQEKTPERQQPKGRG